MKEGLQLEMQDMKARLEVVDSDSRLRLEQELAGFDRQLMDYQTDSHSAAASLSLRIQALEAQNAKVTFLLLRTYFVCVLICSLEFERWLFLVAVPGVVFLPAEASSNPLSWYKQHPRPQPSHPRSPAGHGEVAHWPYQGGWSERNCGELSRPIFESKTYINVIPVQIPDLMSHVCSVCGCESGAGCDQAGRQRKLLRLWSSHGGQNGRLCTGDSRLGNIFGYLKWWEIKF